MQQTGKGKDKNVEPTKDDDNWIPRGVKEMMWAKTKLENGKKRKGAFIKDTGKELLKDFILNAFPNDKFLNWSKFKVFADDKINVT